MEPYPDNLSEAIDEHIRRVLLRVDGNISAAARALGVSRTTIQRRIDLAQSAAEMRKKAAPPPKPKAAKKRSTPVLPPPKRSGTRIKETPKMGDARARRRVIIERTAASRREIDLLIAGADMSDLDGVPVVVGAYKPTRSFRARSSFADEVDDAAPPRTAGAASDGAAGRSGRARYVRARQDTGDGGAGAHLRAVVRRHAPARRGRRHGSCALTVWGIRLILGR